jgi:hypothetical protein
VGKAKRAHVFFLSLRYVGTALRAFAHLRPYRDFAPQQGKKSNEPLRLRRNECYTGAA